MSVTLLTVVLAAAPRLVAPGPRAQTTRDRLHVFVEMPSPTALTLNGAVQTCSAGPSFTQDSGVPLAHCLLNLAPGSNRLSFIESDGGVRELAQLDRYVTTGGAAGVETVGFGAGSLHTAQNEAVCRQCHDLEAPAVAPATKCGPCHAEIVERPKMHGPVQQGACLACHDAASTPSRFAVRWPIQETCFQCHVDIQAAMNRKAFRHGPAAAGRCTTCHDPHGSEQPYWLKLHAFDLCTNCHTEKRERHVVVGFVYSDSHPLRGRPHPLKDNTEFACPACHNPHAAQSRFLWQFNVTTRESLCRTCHHK